MAKWLLERVPRPFNEERRVSSKNGVVKIRYPHLKEWSWILISYSIKRKTLRNLHPKDSFLFQYYIWHLRIFNTICLKSSTPYQSFYFIFRKLHALRATLHWSKDSKETIIILKHLLLKLFHEMRNNLVIFNY